MKHKLDFVTNSSSTAYVITLPNDETIDKILNGIDFNNTTGVLKDYYYELVDDYEFTEDINAFISQIKMYIETLRSQSYLTTNDDVPVPVIEFIEYIFRNYKVFEYDTTSSDVTEIEYISPDRISKIHDLIKS